MKRTIICICLISLCIITNTLPAQFQLKQGYFGVIANTTPDSIKGPQIAALFNSTEKNVTGTQISGLFNYAGSLNGTQVAGLFNTTGDSSKGAQLGGLFNSSESLIGPQIAGLFNYNKSLTGMQVAGLFNESKKLTGIQISGLINRADNISGVQISGLVNYAKKINGLQIGFINIADSCEGAPLGFFSFVKSGYHKIEIASNESKLLTIGLRSGAEKFHNIFFIGADAANKPKLFTYGYGLGSSFYMTKRFNLGMDLTCQHIQPVEINRIYMHLLNKAQVNIEFKAFKKLWISAGPSLNILVSDIKSPYYKEIISFFKPNAYYENKNYYSEISTRFWFGYGVSVKLL